MTRRALAAVFGVMMTAAFPAVAAAHPLGNFTTNHYVRVTVSADSIELDVVVDVAEVPSIELLERLDTDGDGTLGASESDAARRTLCAERLPQIGVRVDGHALDLELWAAGLQRRPGAAGLDTVRIVCEARAANPAPGALTLAVIDGGDPGSFGWREIVVRGEGYTTDPGDAGVDVANRLTGYPTDLLSQPLAERSATVMLVRDGSTLASVPVADAQPLDAHAVGAAGAPSTATVPGGVASELPLLPGLGNRTLGSGLLGLLLAAAAGGGHALSPGHGKTVMAAYLIGSRGRARHAFVLGAAVTASHTLGVIGLGGVVLLASDLLPAERLYPVLGALSGATVTAIGAWLALGCVRRLRAEHRYARHHAHRHPDDHDHDHGHGHGHAHDHDHEPSLPGLRGILALGIAGGLVPSTAALVLLLAAVAAGQPAYGLGMALAFGVGMAAVLTGLGLAIVQGRDRLGNRLARWGARRIAIAPLASVMPWAIALVVLAGGILLTGQALGRTL
jgi:nickel/cobalt exporter